MRPLEADKLMRLITLLLGAALMTACGQMGPLVRPGDSPDRETRDRTTETTAPTTADTTDQDDAETP